MTPTQATRAGDGDPERPRLSKEAVVDQALAIADADGLDALTIRRLASQLGVTPMAFYWHFRSKEALLGGLAERIWGEIDAGVDPAADWPQQLRVLMESLVRVLRAHRSASQILAGGEKLNSDAALRVTETTLAVLHRAGFDPVHASEIARSALWTGIMLVMSTPGFDTTCTDADLAEMQRRNQVRLALLPPARYPRLVEAAGPLTACGAEDQEFHYRFGIDLFIAGVRDMAALAATGQPAR
ncbi:MAG TPA: TetR family transcriptional regulator [Streptosporangiaceae bacterium]|nr:TetR family transcriptional regulator [Streptosporangiaceae bacterium]